MIELTIKNLQNGDIITATTEFLTAQWDVSNDPDIDADTQSYIRGDVSCEDILNRCIVLDETKERLLGENPIAKLLYRAAQMDDERAQK